MTNTKTNTYLNQLEEAKTNGDATHTLHYLVNNLKGKDIRYDVEVTKGMVSAYIESEIEGAINLEGFKSMYLVHAEDDKFLLAQFADFTNTGFPITNMNEEELVEYLIEYTTPDEEENDNEKEDRLLIEYYDETLSVRVNTPVDKFFEDRRPIGINYTAYAAT